MTYLLAAAAFALLLLVIRHARNSRRRQTAWICTLCRIGFGNELDAERHLIVTHQGRAS